MAGPIKKRDVKLSKKLQEKHLEAERSKPVREKIEMP